MNTWKKRSMENSRLGNSSPKATAPRGDHKNLLSKATEAF